jgi:hypothetical protein
LICAQAKTEPSLIKDNRVHVVTPAIDEKETKHISALLSQMKYVAILQVLSEVNNITNFTNSCWSKVKMSGLER